MKGFAVSLDVMTGSCRLSELERALDVPGDHGSHDIGSVGVLNRRIREESLWRIFSSVPEDASIEDHLASLVDRYPPGEFALKSLPSDADVSLAVGLFFDSAMCTVIFSQGLLEIVTAYRARLWISAYPSPSETLVKTES